MLMFVMRYSSDAETEECNQAVLGRRQGYAQACLYLVGLCWRGLCGAPSGENTCPRQVLVQRAQGGCAAMSHGQCPTSAWDACGMVHGEKKGGRQGLKE